MSNLRTWAKWSVAAVLLLSPVLAFLMVIAVEASIDLVLEVGVPAMLDVMAVGAIVWVLFHNHRPRPDGLSRGRGSLMHRPQQFRRSGGWSTEPS
jgi:hypothetical protein